jgi:hypothetical protein
MGTKSDKDFQGWGSSGVGVQPSRETFENDRKIFTYTFTYIAKFA